MTNYRIRVLENELILTSTTSKALRIIKIYPLFQINTGGLPSVGPPDAHVTVVVFDDYECKTCAVLENILKDVLQIYPEEVKLMIKPFPSSNQSFAVKAAFTARAVHGHGKFWEFHRTLFEKQASLNDMTIRFRRLPDNWHLI